jgi:hypothetical protein
MSSPPHSVDSEVMLVQVAGKLPQDSTKVLTVMTNPTISPPKPWYLINPVYLFQEEIATLSLEQDRPLDQGRPPQ